MILQRRPAPTPGCARYIGNGRVVPERLEPAQQADAMALDFKKEDVYDRIQELTQGRDADACIDAVVAR